MRNGLQSAILSLWRRPRFSSLAILTLTTGMFLALLAFAVLHAVVIRDLPYKNPHEIVVLWSSIPLKGIAKDWTSYPTLMDWKRANRSLDHFAVQLRIDTAAMGRQESQRIKVDRASADLFGLLGVSPIRGRTYTEEEETRRERLVLISQDFWLTKFNGSNDIIGKTFELDKKTAKIIGVMPREFAFPSESTDVWMPLTFVDQWPAFLKARQSDGFRAFARLKPGVTIEQARADLATIAVNLSKQYPLTDRDKQINITPLTDEITEPSLRHALWFIMLAVFLVLLVACGHVSSLFLARSYAQRAEFSVRLALGANMWTLMRMRLTESAVISIVSGILAILLTAGLLPVITALMPPNLPRLSFVRIDSGVAGFSLIVSFIAAAAAGLAPAWNAAHTNIADALRGASKGTVGKMRQSGQRLLVAGQFAMTTLLVVVAAVLAISYWKLQKVDLGFQADQVLTASIDNPGSLEKFREIPGVEAVGAASDIFVAHVPNNTIAIEGRGELQSEPNISTIVAGDYFAVLKIPLLQGRSFNADDRANTPRVAIIDQTMAKRFWPQEAAIGERFRYGVPGEDPGAWITIIGVVGATLPNGPESERIPHFYMPLAQHSWLPSMQMVIRANPPDAAVRTIKTATPLQTQLDQLSARRRANTALLLMFSILSMLLTSIGLYALVHFTVIQRTPEIGLRVALGAAPAQVFRLILWHGIRSALSGIATGLAAALILLRMLAGLVHGVESFDAPAFTFAALLLVGVMIAATIGPAFSAATMTPSRALSCE